MRSFLPENGELHVTKHQQWPLKNQMYVCVGGCAYFFAEAEEKRKANRKSRVFCVLYLLYIKISSLNIFTKIFSLILTDIIESMQDPGVTRKKK